MINKNELDFIKEYTLENSDEVKIARINYLNTLLEPKRISWKFWDSEAKKYSGWFADKLKEQRDKIKKEAEVFLKEKEMYQKPPQWQSQKESKEELIAEAKLVPVETLIQFNKAGFANCIKHSEKTPSLKLWKGKNLVHCFGACGKTWDSIDIVMILYDYSFTDAVRYLTGR